MDSPSNSSNMWVVNPCSFLGKTQKEQKKLLIIFWMAANSFFYSHLVAIRDFMTRKGDRRDCFRIILMHMSCVVIHQWAHVTRTVSILNRVFFFFVLLKQKKNTILIEWQHRNYKFQLTSRISLIWPQKSMTI